jgi:hypothetical protein
LAKRIPEIEETLMIRVAGLASPPVRGALEYAQGLRLAVAAAVGYAIDGSPGRGRGHTELSRRPRANFSGFGPDPSSPPGKRRATIKLVDPQ